MLKVMIVDDEPSAIKFLKTIIEQKTEGFEIIDTAENGLDALNKIKENIPDIVITDIKMPVMDGLELCSSIRKEYLDIRTILISGYQEFEYARKAIKEGVVDYLLKPINISSLVELLERLKLSINKDIYRKQTEIFKDLMNKNEPNEKMIKKYLPYDRYGIAVLRIGGIPLHFSSLPYIFEYSENKDILFDITDNIWILEGRDRNEYIFIFSPDLSEFKSFEKKIKGMLDKIVNNYYTVFFVQKYCRYKNVRNVIFNATKTLEENIILGYSQIIYEDNISKSDENSVILDETIERKINFFVSNLYFDKLKEEIRRYINQWVEGKKNLLLVGKNIEYIFYCIKKSTGISEAEFNDITKLSLDKALYYSKNKDTLISNILIIIDEILKKIKSSSSKKDLAILLNEIVGYLENNLAQPIDVQTICKLFNISPSYLNILFNKNMKISFNKYLTKLRIEKSKDIINQYPDMPLKDIAEMVGFNDQFYYSRVFKSIIGLSPSEYKESLNNNK